MKKLIFILMFFLIGSSYAEEIKIVSWNLKDIWNEKEIKKRKKDFISFGKDIDPDILILQEFTDESQLKGVSKHMGVQNFHFASTVFKKGAGTTADNFRSSFEVGILSKYPITEIKEYACSSDKSAGTNSREIKLYPILKGPIASTRGGRGFLWVRIDELKLIVIGVHLKSSSGASGKEDKGNAEKRELVASAIANAVAGFQEDNPDYTFIVAGDFNVGHSDAVKNGADILNDCYKKDCQEEDGYDDTHALLAGGLVRGIKMKNLTLKLDDTYYDPKDRFDGGAIDNIYVHGSGVNGFSKAVKSENRYNSDHYPIWTVWSK